MEFFTVTFSIVVGFWLPLVGVFYLFKRAERKFECLTQSTRNMCTQINDTATRALVIKTITETLLEKDFLKMEKIRNRIHDIISNQTKKEPKL